MSSKHTAGPWKFYVRDKTKPHVLELTGKTLRHDEFDLLGVTLEKYGVDDPESDANARLIAAAPELLRSLKQCRDALMRYTGGTETSLYEISDANAAIRKAEGEMSKVVKENCHEEEV